MDYYKAVINKTEEEDDHTRANTSKRHKETEIPAQGSIPFEVLLTTTTVHKRQEICSQQSQSMIELEAEGIESSRALWQFRMGVANV